MCYCTILFMHPQFLTKNNKSWSLKGLKIKNKYHKLSNTIKHKCLVKLDQMLDFSKNQICILKIWLSSHFECIKYFLWPPDIILWTTFKYGAKKNTSNCLFVFLIEKNYKKGILKMKPLTLRNLWHITTQCILKYILLLFQQIKL